MIDKINYIYMNKPHKGIYEHQNEITDHIYITAFYDIGRDKWQKSSRTINNYIFSFLQFIQTKKNIIAFIDDRYIYHPYLENYLNNIYKNTDEQKSDEQKSYKQKPKFIPINKEWLLKNSESWKKNHISEKIMKSSEYQSLLYSRIKEGHPENISSDYNTINHAKVDFIKYAIDNEYVKDTDFVCWIDFGYYGSVFKNNPFNYPHSDIDIHKFDLSKLNFCLKNKITEKDCDIIYTLTNAPIIFTGGFFAGTVQLMKLLYVLYHECLDYFYENNISDDDQHIYLQCFLKNPDIFQLYLSPDRWPEAPVFFQKDFNIKSYSTPYSIIHNVNDIIPYYDKLKNGQSIIVDLNSVDIRQIPFLYSFKYNNYIIYKHF